MAFAIAYVVFETPLILAGAVVVAGALLGLTSLADSQITTWVLLWTLLPVVNAGFDWLSWQISRWLGDRLLIASEDPGRTRWSRLSVYIVDIAIDVAFALVFLAGLAWTIPRVIEAWNAFVRWMGDEPSLNLAAYLCNAAREPLAEGFWAVGMLFSTLLPTTIHLLFLVCAPLFWFVAWAFGAHDTNRARAAHIELGTRPPKVDLVQGAEGEIRDLRAMPVDYGRPGFREERPIFQGQLNPQTVHKVALQLRVWRPLIYMVTFGLLAWAIVQYTPPLIAQITHPLPELLLWIASNFDDAAVRQCFPPT